VRTPPVRSIRTVAHGATLLVALLAAAGRARAAEPSRLPGTSDDARAGRRAAGDWAALALLTGSTQPDAALADYQWDTRPKMAWGAQALAGRGRFGAGVRLWSSRTTQQVDLAGVAVSPTVRSTSVELVGRVRVADLRGLRLLAAASGGRLHLGYDPDRLAIPTGGGSIEVSFAPVYEWIAGVGAAVERPLGAHWTVGAQVERRGWALDTAHRSSAQIVNARESFGEWNARFEFARVFSRR